jgi:hypothetical protein
MLKEAALNLEQPLEIFFSGVRVYKTGNSSIL